MLLRKKGGLTLTDIDAMSSDELTAEIKAFEQLVKAEAASYNET